MYQYLEEELEKLRTKLIKMGSLVEEQLDSAFRCLMESNLELGKQVIDKDKKVDKFDVKIDKLCQIIFAITQPVALDLRMIMSSLKINTDLERMGDIAVNLVQRAESLEPHIDLMKNIGIEEMISKLRVIITKSIDSFVNVDRDTAIFVLKSDDEIDRMEREIFDNLITVMENDKSLIKPGANLITIIKNLERLADHATNIAEEVIFLIEAKIIKHKKNLGGLDTKKDDVSE